MNKKELIQNISYKTGVKAKDVESITNAILDVIKDEVANEGKVQIVGFGTFEIRRRQAREGFNPMTKEPIVIPESTVPAFRPGKEFKEFVKRSRG